MILFPRPTSRLSSDADESIGRRAEVRQSARKEKRERERRTFDDRSDGIHNSSLVSVQRSALVLEPVRKSLLLLLKLLDRLLQVRGLSLVLVDRGRGSFLVRVGFGEVSFHLLTRYMIPEQR